MDEKSSNRDFKVNEAKGVAVAPVDVRLTVDDDFRDFVKNCLVGRVLVKGETSVVTMLGHAIPFIVTKTNPRGIVKVTSETKLMIFNEPIPRPKLTAKSQNSKTMSYEINLKNLGSTGSDGTFLCPKCETLISPDDETQETYQILKIVVENEELEKLVVLCKKCGSKIDIGGFT